ncbi:MAG: class I SAM-dependent methyltransferase [Candidatus Sumerlaeota bacterium]|nr:class I SAM-dependent methyltransferase [Candidatus Sumerlaeota bacterium]
MRPFLDLIHGGYVFARRTRILARRIADWLPRGARVLDVGCGDGNIDWRIAQCRPDVAIEGIDVLVRPSTRIPVKAFDGRTLPYPDQSFDAVLFVDVLHHARDPGSLLAEARRVASRCVVIKDHLREGWGAAPALRFMDWVGNERHHVALPYTYWTRAQWAAALRRAGLQCDACERRLRLYPWWADWIFGRSLQVLMRLTAASPSRGESGDSAAP